MTKYSEFVKSWAEEHNLSYGCAVSDPRLKIDFIKFKNGESYGKEMDFQPAPKKKAEPKMFEITPAPKKKAEPKMFEITPAKKKKIEKEFIEIIPAAKLKSVQKSTKVNIKKIKDAMVVLVEKFAGKLKDLEVKKLDMSISTFKEQKQNLLEKLDNVIEKILHKQETSSEELIDILEIYIDELTLIYKKIDGIKEPSKKKVEAKAKAKEESVEEKTQKLIAERVLLKEKLKIAEVEKNKIFKQMNSVINPSEEMKMKVFSAMNESVKLNGKLGEIQDKIYELNGRYL